jgi:DNA-binding TFAR19-related protein (PDSD5 family)
LSEENELELYKRKKLLEMQMRLLAKKAEEEKKQEEPEKAPDPKEVLNRIFVDRAWEVFEAARRQYPRETQTLQDELVRLILSGKLKEQITGEQLLWLFRKLGLDVRMETKIRILESGELKTIAEKLKGEE